MPVEAEKAASRWTSARASARWPRPANVGELFQYSIATPVSLPRHQSAMLPIVNERRQRREGLDLQPSVQAKHPLNGLQLKNTTELHLMQGPITVFDGGAYAGDARSRTCRRRASG